MRRSGPRAELPNATRARLDRCTSAIRTSTDQTAEAANVYETARRAKWFQTVVEALSSMAGPGLRCMYCGGSEAGQVEHYKPKSLFPDLALDWGNLLWICGLCNQFKGAQFDEALPLIDPVDEDVWRYFFIDEFGNLQACWDEGADEQNQRALKTIAVLKLDRQALQESRLARLQDLRQKARDALVLLNRGEMDADQCTLRALDWFVQPFQPEVADYFLGWTRRAGHHRTICESVCAAGSDDARLRAIDQEISPDAPASTHPKPSKSRPG